MAAYSYIREKNHDAANKELETFVAAMQKEGQTAFAVDAILATAFIAKDVPSAFAGFDRAIVSTLADHNLYSFSTCTVWGRTLVATEEVLIALLGRRNYAPRR